MSDTFAAIAAANTAEEATEILTFDAAMALGILDKAGTIEKGKRADFVIYDRNPLEAYNAEEFKRMKAVMTIMGGQVVYDSEDENLDEWYEIISSQAY